MIRLVRGAEPPELVRVRDGDGKAPGELARVRALAQQGAPSSGDIGRGYSVAARALWEGQHLKCAYCEGQESVKRNDVEHFRPKGRIDEGGGRYLTPGYWWLAWSWRNLLFSCRNCNQAPAKLDKFPIEPGSRRLVAEEEPPGGERPLLLDPYVDEPMDHIVFTLAKVRGMDRWGPVARNGSPRGHKTIEVLLLDRDDLLDLYAKHVRDHVEPEVEELGRAIAKGDPPRVDEVWRRALRTVSPARPFAALSHDALDWLVPPARRAQWGLSLSRPPLARPPTPPTPVRAP